MQTIHSFNEKLAYSRGIRETTDLEVLKQLLTGCTEIVKTTLDQDRSGVDYIATLRKGAAVLIDAKTRTAGCSKYWREGPEIALETWSVLPERGKTGKVGWTLNESSSVDYILFTFDTVDTNNVFLYPFQLLRVSFRRNLPSWHKKYKVDIQNSGTWKSECVFVPESIVWESLRESMQG